MAEARERAVMGTWFKLVSELSEEFWASCGDVGGGGLRGLVFYGVGI